MSLTHLDDAGQARMVDVGSKPVSRRRAVAEGRVLMSPGALDQVREATIVKGDVRSVAEVAGVMAAKRTSESIPLCHPVPLTSVAVDFSIDAAASAVECRARVECTARTGVEMEALTAVQVGLLTIYDMCKAVDRGMTLEATRLLEKRGGKSGTWVAP